MMRIGFPGQQRVRMTDHLLGHMRVQIQGNHDGNIGTNKPAGCLNHVALRIIPTFGQGGPVEWQQYSVDRQ